MKQTKNAIWKFSSEATEVWRGSTEVKAQPNVKNVQKYTNRMLSGLSIHKWSNLKFARPKFKLGTTELQQMHKQSNIHTLWKFSEDTTEVRFRSTEVQIGDDWTWERQNRALNQATGIIVQTRSKF